MTKSLWIGAGGHEPSPRHPCSLLSGISWQARKSEHTLFSYLTEKGLVYGKPSEFEIADGKFISNKNTVRVADIGAVLFSWNYARVTRTELSKFAAIQKALKESNSNTQIVNPITSLEYLHRKSHFLSLMQSTGLGELVPKYSIVTSPKDLRRIPFGYPHILKADNLSGGKDTYLVRDLEEAKAALRKIKLKKYLAYLKVIQGYYRKIDRETILTTYKPSAIIAVEYFDTMQPEGFYMTGRAFFLGQSLYFAYPHVAETNWCIHTDMGRDQPPKSSYIKACERIHATIRNYKQHFQDVQNAVGIGTLAIDFLVSSEGTPRFLEIELKYGPDGNFHRGQEEKYGLDARHVQWVQEQLEVEPLTSYGRLFLRSS